MRSATIGWMWVLNVAAVASLSLKPFGIFDLTQGTDDPPKISPRIYNGLRAGECQFKFMILVVIELGGKWSICSGSLVAPSWVLTAGHCLSFRDVERVILAGGRANLCDYVSDRMASSFEPPLTEWMDNVQERAGVGIFIHPKYNNITYEHDVALIRTNKPFVLGCCVTPIPLSTRKITSRKKCTILGWGKVAGNEFPLILNHVEGKEVSTTELGCFTSKEGRFICPQPGKQGICEGDSGSPLVCEDQVWGVASHMEGPWDTEYICGNHTAEFYTEIYYDLEWLLSYVKSGSVSRDVSLKTFVSCLMVSFCLSLTF